MWHCPFVLDRPHEINFPSPNPSSFMEDVSPLWSCGSSWEAYFVVSPVSPKISEAEYECLCGWRQRKWGLICLPVKLFWRGAIRSSKQG